MRLPHHAEVEVVWVVKLFHSGEADLMILLLGERTSALTGYVMSWVRTVPGVMDTQLTSVLDWRILGQTEDFIALAQRFPEPAAGWQVIGRGPYCQMSVRRGTIATGGEHDLRSRATKCRAGSRRRLRRSRSTWPRARARNMPGASCPHCGKANKVAPERLQQAVRFAPAAATPNLSRRGRYPAA